MDQLFPPTMADMIACARREVKFREIIITDSLIERFEAKCYPEPNSGCWLWIGSIRSNGYGQIFVGKKSDKSNYPAQAHRVSYTLFRGPIPKGMVLDHKCRNKVCVNPDHLDPVSNAENVRRGNPGMHMKYKSAAATACRNGHPRTSENTYRRQQDGAIVCKDCVHDRKIALQQRKGQSASRWVRIQGTPLERFRYHIVIRDDDQCWLYQGTLRAGYGQFWNKNKLVQAHRFSYEMLVGPIPPGAKIIHKCENRDCCNPSHLLAKVF